ncbi:hypothetical protein ACFQZ4_44005 [Catellatospora coxensis]
MSDLIAALLADFDLLPFYRDRVRLLSRHARDLAGTAEFAELLAELSAGNRVQREMALFMATVAGHRPVIEAALTDPDQSLRSAAVTAWLRDDARTADELWEWLADAPANLRRKAFRVLRADRLSTLADGVIDRVRARYGDVEAASLLPTCGGETVRRQLPVLGHAVGNWAALGRWHPDPVLSWVDDQLREAGPDGERCWWRYGPGIWAAARRLPEKVLDLLEAHAPGTHLPGDLTSYGVLADVDPHRVLALLTAPDRADWTSRGRLPRALLRRFALLDVDDLAELARRLRVDRAGTALPVLLNAVAPRHRERLYDAAYEGAEQSLGMLSDQVLDVLPHRRRVVEAQRMLGLAEARADERVTLRLTAFLPWEQAQPALAAGTRAAEADDRAYAYRLLVGCAPRSRDAAAVTGSVEFLRRLRNEQDPVRRQALDALARVNPLLVDAAAVEALDQIVTDATQARDGSGPTRDALKRLAVNVLQCHTDTPELSRWAQRTLGRLFGDDRLPSLYGLHRQLRRGQEEQFFAAVRDWVVAAVARGGHGPLFAVAEGLGPRAWRLPELQEMLENSINAGNVSGVLSRAVTLWLDDPKTRPARVEQVLRWDTSTVTIPGSGTPCASAVPTCSTWSSATSRPRAGSWRPGRAGCPDTRTGCSVGCPGTFAATPSCSSGSRTTPVRPSTPAPARSARPPTSRTRAGRSWTATSARRTPCWPRRRCTPWCGPAVRPKRCRSCCRTPTTTRRAWRSTRWAARRRCWHPASWDRCWRRRSTARR